MGEKRGNWTKLDSEVVHKNPYYQVRKDKVIKPDGSMGDYHVVESKGAVFIVAVDEEQNVYLEGLHRYTTNTYSLEIQAGGIDDDDPLTAAKRELEEEAGLIAEHWKQLGEIYPANGIFSEKNFVFLATGLKPSSRNSQEEEGITEIIKVQLRESLQMIKSGKITDSQTIAALTLACLEIGII